MAGASAFDPVASPPAAALQAALSLPGASLVIQRHGILVEFKTERLREGLSRSVHGSHTSWQVGAFDDHHFHPDLSRVRAIEFDAQPSPCQGGRLNFTVWFLCDGDCGNPNRRDALFSVTLNAPYGANGEPGPEIDAMYALHARLFDWPLVAATQNFLAQGSRHSSSAAPL